MSASPGPAELDTVLLIDDDVELCRMLQDYLSRHGWSVSMAHRGSSGLTAALEMRHGLIVLDVMLPDFDGFELLRRLRHSADADVYVLLLTARGEEIDRIVGLELGADDYLPKPFNPRELLARMRAIVRRGAPRSTSSEEPHAPTASFTIDHAVRTIRYADQALELTDLEFDLLHHFLTHPSEVLNREQLVERILERPYRPLDRSLDMLVSRLRRKLEALPGFSGGIKAVRSNGYLFYLES
ncbi:response regulator transcription factor [Silvibacterium dinghuense]|uniref:Response regulator transcription factor n=1 Tax=Silvibacterium dinghuense TaxID=1560006 RepID=A0A4Q1S939_9BACT|nr:response regulator transcription factor [Silvibacterium dinghuense]RXS93415.1 response regulator transcription factor [Silvibacterium dinghuense]GGH05617.1 DNA-binding response regulator [Silvibacterium dinghuense]